MHGVYSGVHLDTTLQPLRPGLLLINGDVVDQSKLPDIFKSWDIILAPEFAPTPDYPSTKGFEVCNTFCSDALGMNLGKSSQVYILYIPIHIHTRIHLYI